MGTIPHEFDPPVEEILLIPHKKKDHWVIIVSTSPIKKPAGFPAGFLL
jgi:hypothetical protein